MEANSTNHTTNTQFLSMAPPHTEAHSCCSLLPYSNTPLQGHILFPPPNMAAENKPQELLAFPHKHFETEVLKYALLE